MDSHDGTLCSKSDSFPLLADQSSRPRAYNSQTPYNLALTYLYIITSVSSLLILNLSSLFSAPTFTSVPLKSCPFFKAQHKPHNVHELAWRYSRKISHINVTHTNTLCFSFNTYYYFKFSFSSKKKTGKQNKTKRTSCEWWNMQNYPAHLDTMQIVVYSLVMWNKIMVV